MKKKTFEIKRILCRVRATGNNNYKAYSWKKVTITVKVQ